MSSTVASAINLSRAFSKRISHRDSHNGYNPLASFNIHRSSKRHSDMGIKKGLISGPVELISTTNSQLFPTPGSTVRSSTSIEIPPSPEMSSPGSPPPLTPDKARYTRDLGIPTPPTTPPVDRTFSNFRIHSRSGSAASNSTDMSYNNRSRHSASSSTSSNSSVPPAVPQRKSSASTTTMTRKSAEAPPAPTLSIFPPPPKSARRLNKSFSSGALRSAANNQTSVHNMITMKPVNYGSAHPFRKELAQVSELAEEMGLDLDEDAMIRRGLHKFSAEDYLAEVEDVVIVKGLFGRQPSVRLGGAGWI